MNHTLKLVCPTCEELVTALRRGMCRACRREDAAYRRELERDVWAPLPRGPRHLPTRVGEGQS